ncbi:MAG: cytochrome c biogenesis protein ResB [Gammaproteobacteria bacterium]
MKIIRRLSSLRLTLASMLALGIGVLVRYFDQATPDAWMTLPLLLLALNLVAALLVNQQFRRQPALLLFHVCLLAFVLLAAGSQLGSLQGRLEITEGQVFSPAALNVVRQGAWHPWQRLEDVSFEQGALSIDYNPGIKRGRTSSRLLLKDGPQGRNETVIGDNTPFEAGGYRFYTTSNKGYSAIIAWVNKAGRELTGAVNFPSYPVNDWQQLNEWTSPAGETLKLELLIQERPSYTQPWKLESGSASVSLHVTVDGKILTLDPGEHVMVGNNALRFEAVRLWMGYEVRYEPLLPWMFAIALIGVLALAWHFQRRLSIQLPDTGMTHRHRQKERQHAVGIPQL